jgi:hypothetical protein
MTHSSRHHPEISVSVKIDLATAGKSRSILKALIPDNVNFPKGLSLKMFARGPILHIRLDGKSVSPETLASTLDEILEHVSLCKKVMPA